MPLKGPLTKHHIQRDYGLEIKMLPQLNSWCLLTKQQQQQQQQKSKWGSILSH